MPSTVTDRLNGLTTSVAVKASVQAITTANITLSGLTQPTLLLGSGVTLAENTRVLVKDQTDPSKNGIYLASTSDWPRSKDFDGARDVVNGTLVVFPISIGNGAFYQVECANDPVIGSTAITFSLLDNPNVTYPQNAAEISGNLTPIDTTYTAIPIDVLRYGIVPNNAGAATANTTKIRALLLPTTTGPIGKLIFPPITGADTYYFNGVIPFREDIDIELYGCALDYTATGSAAETNSGFLFARRSFGCHNGRINVNFATGVATSAGNAIQIGARGTDSSFWTPVYDSLLAKRIERVHLSDLEITINNSGANLASCGAIAMIGGIRRCTIERTKIKGSGTLTQAVIYEFGWATSPAGTQTSHMRNWHFDQIDIENLDPSAGIGFVVAGAYNGGVSRSTVTSAASFGSFTPGESLNYAPETDQDDVGAGRTVKLSQNVGQQLSGTGLILTGAQSASGGYLAATIAGLGHPADYVAQTDLADYDVEDIVLSGTSGGFGILCSAGFARIANPRIRGFEQGIVGTDEWTRVAIENPDIRGCTKAGINLDGGSAIYSSPRLKTGYIKGGIIAGNSTSSAGTYPGIALGHTGALTVEGTRLNYELAHDGVDETTQGNAVQLATTALGVTCRNNRVGVVLGGSFAYFSASSDLNGNDIVNPQGTKTRSGGWNADGTGIASSTQVGAKASNVNTFGKYEGRRVLDNSNHRLMIARGSVDTDPWDVADGSTNVVPA